MARLIKLLPTVPAVAEAFAAGELSEAQAAEIAQAADTVPACVREEAAAVLLGQAASLKPEELRIAGRRILRHVDPDKAEEHERKQIEREDRLAWEARAFTVSADGTGRYQLSGYTTGEGAAILKAALDPLCNPARTKPSPLDTCNTSPTATGEADCPCITNSANAISTACLCKTGPAACLRNTGPAATVATACLCSTDTCAAGQACESRRGEPGEIADTVREMAGQPLPQAFRDPRTPAQRRHDALLELIDLALKTDDLPANSGTKTQLVITAPYDVTAQKVQDATLDTGEQLTATTIRRLTCDARIIPSILDTNSVPLDLGRERRLITGPLRRALTLRDKGCAFPGCDRPPKWCHAHHINHWIDGGTTNLHNSVLICGFHHRLLHHNEWHVTITNNGHPEFTPPAWPDPTQRPQRNLYHLRT